MFKRNNFFASIFVFAIAICFYCLKANKNYNVNSSTKPKISVKSTTLMQAYFSDEKKADKLYTDEVIEVVGSIKEISFLNEKTTIFLNSDFNNASFICELNDVEKEKLKTLKKNDTIKIKGICKGFLKDIVLLNCFLDTIKTNE